VKEYQLTLSTIKDGESILCDRIIMLQPELQNDTAALESYLGMLLAKMMREITD
jgi:hypothetical protein